MAQPDVGIDSTGGAVVYRGRLLLVLAAVLWSLAGLFARLLTTDSVFGVNEPRLTSLQIAFFRALFAGLIFVPMLRRRDMTFRPSMLVMVACFAGMIAVFLSAMVLGPAANAILLQNTAPFWVYLIGVHWLREPADRRSWNAIKLGMLGVGIIIGAGTLRESAQEGFDQSTAVLTAMGLASGLLYAGVILCLRRLRDHSSIWLTTQNQLGSALFLGAAICIVHGPAYWWQWITTPTVNQIVFLALFGIVQLGIPYFVFAYALRRVSAYEAGAIILLEPILNPVWAFLVSPETDTPPWSTCIGGALIIGALAWRYAPRTKGKSFN